MKIRLNLSWTEVWSATLEDRVSGAAVLDISALS
jgi:hypothetical protein